METPCELQAGAPPLLPRPCTFVVATAIAARVLIVGSAVCAFASASQGKEESRMATLTESSPGQVTLKVCSRYEGRTIWARVLLVGESELADGMRVTLELVREKTGEVVATREIPDLLRCNGATSFDLGETDSGCCCFRATVRDRHGLQWKARVLHDKDPGEADWLGSPAGIARDVPSPWTPVTVKSSAGTFELGCWNRVYVLDGRHGLTQVSSGDVPVLARPMRWHAVIDGKATEWRTEGLRIAAQDAEKVVMEQRVADRGTTINSRITLEFDGMMRVDCAFDTEKPVEINRLSLEIPISRKIAKYLYYFPGSWGSAENVRALPHDGLSMGFRPFIWLGDEERGLAWFAESDEGWYWKDPDGLIEIRPDGDAMTLRLDMISMPVRLLPAPGHISDLTGFGQAAQLFAKSRSIRGLRYTFGLQATPVKPVQRDAWDYRTVCIGANTPGFTPRLSVSDSLLDRLVEAGVRAVVIFEYWTDAEGYVDTPHREDLAKVVRACHDRGLQALLYFSFLISDIAPEWEMFGKESVIIPKGGYPVFHYLPQPEQAAWRVCLRSQWQDRLVSGIAEALRSSGADGVYLDGTEYPFGCCNTEHGCGALHPDGSIRPTYPIFSVRSAMRRIYRVVLSHRPEGQVNVHNSTCMTIPTLAWATSYWDGEQFGHIPRGTDVGSLLPLDAFRAEFMGRQWGVPAEFLCYGQPLTFRQTWALTLIHDVPVRPILGPGLEDLAFAARIWKVMDEFDRSGARWLPYWNNSDFVQTFPEGTYASLYLHPRNGLLAVVSNLTEKEASVALRLNLRALGIENAPATLRDCLDGREMKLDDGTVSLAIPAMDFSLLRLGGGGR